ncbi:hypothetical protein Mapa_005260 [Marchantia paleacea]|nr:hypothetical protein Mapa_005260 [Marchantia paleacea]
MPLKSSQVLRRLEFGSFYFPCIIEQCPQLEEVAARPLGEIIRTIENLEAFHSWRARMSMTHWAQVAQALTWRGVFHSYFNSSTSFQQTETFGYYSTANGRSCGQGAGRSCGLASRVGRVRIESRVGRVGGRWDSKQWERTSHRRLYNPRTKGMSIGSFYRIGVPN